MKKLSYEELKHLKTFEERFDYLNLEGKAFDQTFGFNRHLNQAFYKSKEWKDAKNRVILRDGGNDLGIDGRPAGKGLTVHHMNPITEADILDRNPDIYNPDYLICVSHNTHNALHYGDKKNLLINVTERKPNDHLPWKSGHNKKKGEQNVTRV